MLDTAMRKTEATLAILLAVDAERDRLISLEARASEGATSTFIEMPLGTGVSGWVAVNGTPMVNADAALDFRDASAGRELERMMCVPVHYRGHIIGVVSLYSGDPRGFSDEDRVSIQQLIAGLDAAIPYEAFQKLLEQRRLPHRDSPTVH
jgi:putative methionine-R-sulfoxide reductase with GAF domain